MGANVSVDQIYSLALATHESVTRIETRQENQQRQLSDQDRRLRSLEQWRLALAGVNLATVVGLVIALLQVVHH